jgi:hypothetical protein
MLLPLPDNTWHRVASMYGRIIPMCRNFHDMMNNDLERVTQVLSELECPYDYCEFDEVAVSSQFSLALSDN